VSNRLAVYTNAYGPAGVREAARSARSAGLRDLELAMKPHDHGGLIIPQAAIVNESTDPDEADDFVALLADRGVGLTACNVGGGDLRTIEGLDLTVRRMHLARGWFGVGVVVGNAGSPGDRGERAALVDNLQALGRHADSLGVVVALETHRGPTQNAEAMLDLMGEVNHPRIRLNFDTGNILYYNRAPDVLAELRRVARWVANVHLKDSRGVFEEWHFPALGDGGAVDFAGVRSVLRQADYRGAFAVEIEGIGGEAEPGIEERRERVRRSVEHLRACGYQVD